MNQGASQGLPRGGGGGQLSGDRDMTGDNEKTSGGGTVTETKLAPKRQRDGPSTPAPSARSSLAPRLNAAVPAFTPRTPAGQAPLSDSEGGLKSHNSASPRPSLSSQTEEHSVIRDAFLAAPVPKSFLELIDQTQAIVLTNSVTAQGAQARELSEISSRTVFKANLAVFNATGAFKRTRSPAFPQLSQDQPPTSAHISTTIPGQSLVGPLIEPSGPTSGQVTTPVPISSVIRRTIPVAHGAAISTPATLPAQVQASYITPARGSLAYRNLRSISGLRRPRHMHNQSLSQPATRLFSAPRPVPSSFSTSRGASRPLPQRQFVTPTKSSLGASQSLTQDSPLNRPNDTEEQKKIINSVMSSFREVGDNIYDTLEWSQNEEQDSYGESPEPLTVPPQPVASYTTVGSLRPATNQHFTAPNRIQRDGSGRRAPQANFQGRGHDSHVGVRNMNQQYNPVYGSSTNLQHGAMNYSGYGSVNQLQFNSSTQPQFGPMHQPQYDPTSQSRFGSPALPQHGNMSQSQYGAPTYPQYGSSHQRQYGPLTQYAENHTHYGSSSQSGFGSINNLQNIDDSRSMALTEAEKNVLQANGLSEPLIGNSRPSMRSGNIPQQHHDMTQKFDPSLNPQAESFNLHSRLQNNGSDQTNSAQNSMPKIENMQNLPQHENPMQQLAKDHVAEEAATTRTQQVAMPTGLHVAQQSTMAGTASYGQTVNGDDDQGNTGYENQDGGDFDHIYRFPPPGLVHPTQANRSGSDYGQQAVSGFGSYEQVTTNQPYQMHSGRPQPLTAGPPGQRQNAGFVTTGMSSAQGIQVNSSQLSSLQIPPVLPLNSPWLPHSRNNMFTSIATEHSRIRDTLPIEELRQYYPNGFPSNMTGHYTCLPGATEGSRPGMSEEEIKTEKTNKWFHAGVRNLYKTANDHVADMEKRNYNLDHGLPHQPPSTLDERGNPLTLKEIVAMSEPEVSARLLGPIFGNTLKLADQRAGPNSPAMLSRYAPAPLWAIDNSEQGNQSFFGEDWGPTPRRAGRDPRYQRFD